MENEPEINPNENWRVMYECLLNMNRRQNERLRELRVENQRLKRCLDLAYAQQAICRIQPHA